MIFQNSELPIKKGEIHTMLSAIYEMWKSYLKKITYKTIVVTNNLQFVCLNLFHD